MQPVSTLEHTQRRAKHPDKKNEILPYEHEDTAV